MASQKIGESYDMTLRTHSKPKNWRAGKWSECDKRQRGFGMVEKMFYCYKAIKNEVAEVRAEQECFSSHRKDGGGSSNHAYISDPTAQIALRHIEPIRAVTLSVNGNVETIANPEKWVYVVEQTLQYFQSDSFVYKVLKARFIDNEPMPKTCIKQEITESKYYRLRDEGIIYARECAIQLGLIKVF